MKNSRKSILILITALFVFMAGCIAVTLNPIYHQEDLVLNDQVLGEWVGARSIWSFTKDGDLSYHLSYKECSEPISNPSNYSSCTLADFKVRFVKINGHYFADFHPINYSNTDNQLLLFHIRALHSFAKMQLLENKLKVAFLDYQWMERQLESNPEEIDHLVTSDGIILTGNTDQLQYFISTYSNNNEAFSDDFVLRSNK
jgi:hypothetical protein